MDVMHEGLVPDLSLGTHFFHELVEMDILYIGYFNQREGNKLNMEFINDARNELESLLPEKKSFASVVKVIDATEERSIYLVSNLIEQTATVFASGSSNDRNVPN